MTGIRSWIARTAAFAAVVMIAHEKSGSAPSASLACQTDQSPAIAKGSALASPIRWGIFRFAGATVAFHS
jgi:hypothetical protein